MSLFEKTVLIEGYPLKIPLRTRLNPSRFTAEDLVSINASYSAVQFWLLTFRPLKGAEPGEFWRLGVKMDLERRIVEGGCKIPETQYPLFVEVACRLHRHFIPGFLDILERCVVDPETLYDFWLYFTDQDYFCDNSRGIAHFLPYLDKDTVEVILTSLDDSDRSMLLTQVASANLYNPASALPDTIARTSASALESFLGSMVANGRTLDQRLLETLQYTRYPKTLAKAFCVPLTYGFVGCEPENAAYHMTQLDRFVDHAYPYNPYRKTMEYYDPEYWVKIFANMCWLGRTDFRTAYYCLKSDHECEKIEHYEDNANDINLYVGYEHHHFLELVLQRDSPRDRVDHLFTALDLNWRFHDALNGKGSWRLLDEAMLFLRMLPTVGRNTMKTALRKLAGKMGGSLPPGLFAPNKLQYYFLTWEVCDNFARAVDIADRALALPVRRIDETAVSWDNFCRQELYAWYYEWLETHMTSDMYRFLSN